MENKYSEAIFSGDVNRKEFYISMKTIRYALVFAFAFGLLLDAASVASTSRGRISLAKRAIETRMCYDDYWRGKIFRPGGYVSLEIRFSGENLHVIASGDLAAGDGVGYVFYKGRIKNGQAAITDMSAYTTSDLTGTDQGGHSFQEMRKKVEGWELYKGSVIMPIDCTPHYDVTSPKKEMMIDSIISTVKYILSIPREGREASRIQEVTLTIADFNIDYPYTYVLVEPIGEVFTLALHDPKNYDSVVDGHTIYRWVESYRTPDTTIEKIREHGIVKKIECAS
ncbi:MAG: hypothetical protein WAN11_13425 [Syntrophobacteraceae bacterium]